MNEEYLFEKVDDEFCREIKQHLNLSESAWITIEEDMKNFYNSEEKQTFSGFLNEVFRNFYSVADASINNRLIEKGNELEALYTSDEFKDLDKKSIKTFIDKYLNVYEEQLKIKAHSYQKGEGRKFRINKDTIEILKESLDATYYEGLIGEYMKAIFEEYCLKPAYIREQIFFKETYDEVEKAIYKEKKLKITQIERTTVKGDKKYNQKFYFTPYKIVQNKVNTYNYVVGYSEPIHEEIKPDENGKTTRTSTVGDKRIACIRLSRIDKVDIMVSMGAHISKKKKKELDKALITKGADFMTGELQKIVIKFTEKGLESFRRQIYMRPQTYTVSEEDNHIYEFTCTDRQAYNYFWKFGWDAMVLEPEYLADRFRKHYENAYKSYSGISKAEQIAAKEKGE